jgi:hypothetical protein
LWLRGDLPVFMAEPAAESGRTGTPQYSNPNTPVLLMTSISSLPL